MAEGNGLFHLVQDQFTPQFIRSLLFRPPLTGGAILGNGSVIEIEADCWSKAQSDGRYPLVATFNSLGSTVTSIDGRVTALENAPGVAPTADLTVNSLTATSFVQMPLLQSAAADLRIQNGTTTIRAEDGTLLASFAAGSIGLEQDITVRSDRTLNATTADFAQFFVGSTAATGAFTSSSSITATQQIESDLRVQAPPLRCDPAASGFVNLSDKVLKTNVRDLSEKELQETFDAVEPRMYDRVEGGKDQIGFIAQEVQATPLGERVCKTKNLDGRELMTLDYQKLNVVLGRGEVPAEANRKAREEEARALGLARSNGRRGGESARRSGRQLA